YRVVGLWNPKCLKACIRDPQRRQGESTVTRHRLNPCSQELKHITLIGIYGASIRIVAHYVVVVAIAGYTAARAKCNPITVQRVGVKQPQGMSKLVAHCSERSETRNAYVSLSISIGICRDRRGGALRREGGGRGVK